MKTSRKEVFFAVNGEREYQDIQWPDHSHSVGEYLTLLRVYLSKAEKDWMVNDEQALDELRKLVSLGVACMEENGVVYREGYAYNQ